MGYTRWDAVGGEGVNPLQGISKVFRADSGSDCSTWINRLSWLLWSGQGKVFVYTLGHICNFLLSAPGLLLQRLDRKP